MKLTLQLAVGWLAATGALVWCQALGKVPPFPLPMLVAMAFVILCFAVVVGGLWSGVRVSPRRWVTFERAVFVAGMAVALAGGVVWKVVF